MKVDYSDLSPDRENVKIGDKITVGIELTNVSDTDGTEIVQLYYRDTVCKILRPVRTLLDFKRVPIKRGEKVKVEFTVDTAKLGYIDEKCEYRIDEGEIKLFLTGDGVSFKEARINLIK